MVNDSVKPSRGARARGNAGGTKLTTRPRDVPGGNHTPMTQRPDLRLTRQGGNATPEAQDEVLDWKDATRDLNNLSSRISSVFVYYLLFLSIVLHM